MGNFQYRKKKYKEAIVYYEKVDATDLNNNELSEYYFKLGYSYFSIDCFRVLHEEAEASVPPEAGPVPTSMTNN